MSLPKKVRNQNITFWAIITMGLVLRVLALTQHDFWLDEAFTFYLSKLPIKQILSASLADNNPPLFHVLIHFVNEISKNEIILRLPSFAAGIATIFLTYLLVLKFISKSAALLSAALVSFSPLTIYLSTEARPHSLGILFATLEIFVFLTLLKNPTHLISLFFVLITIIGIYTHYYIVLLLVPFTFLVIKERGLLSLKKWLTIILLSALPTLPWVIFSLKFNHSNCWCPTTLLALSSTFVSPATSGVGTVNLRAFTDLPKEKFLLLAITSLVTVFYFARGLTKNFYLSAIYLGPLIILSTIGIFSHFFSPRAFAIFSPIYLSILAIGARSSSPKKLIIPTLLFLLGSISLLESQDDFFRGSRLKAVYNLVKTENVPITHTSVITYYPIKYYSGDELQNYLIAENPLSLPTVEYIGGKKSHNLPKSNKLWIVDNEDYKNQREEHQQAIAKLLPNYYVKKTFQFDNIFVSLLEPYGVPENFVQ